jgi:hypothetical protein
VRTRIALATAVAVIVVPSLLFALFAGSPSAAARTTRQLAFRQDRATKVSPRLRLTSYADARQVSPLATYADAVTRAQVASYLQRVAFYKALQLQTFYGAILRQETAVAPAAASGSDAASTDTPDWSCIRAHESGDDYAADGGGAYQFELATWSGLTGLPSPAQDYPPSVQDAAALKLYGERGWEPWTTSAVCGL